MAHPNSRLAPRRLSGEVALNRQEVAVLAEREGIRPTTFGLEGGLPPERYVLSMEEGGWAVYYSERGLRTGERRFETEDEACRYLWRLLVEDPTTRARKRE
jgi:hypothetical protein